MNPFESIADRRYGAILADPPWSWVPWSKKGIGNRAADKHYDTLDFDSLTRLPVNLLAAENCALFLWAVDSHLDQAISLLNLWEFTYKTIAFIWVKPSIGLGKWTRKEAEVCLLATRGKPRCLAHDVRQVINAPRREHSRKPDEIYGRIERLVSGPYLEMFARQRRDGWDSWGLETKKFSAV